MIYINNFLNYPNPQDYILRYDFNGDLLDKSINAIHGIGSGTYAFATGRKGLANECIQFTAGGVKTSAILPINGNKVTHCCWMSTNQTTTAVVLELTADINSNNAFNLVINNANVVNTLSSTAKILTAETRRTDINHDASWVFVGASYNRDKAGIERITLYINGNPAVLSDSRTSSGNNDFPNDFLNIGSRNSSTVRYNGKMQELKIFNRELSAKEHKGIYLSSL